MPSQSRVSAGRDAPPGRSRRGRGRPAASEPSGEALREAIVTAAATVYASQGFSGSSVERIISAARVSRPTFYKHFKDRREVLDIVIARANDILREIATDRTVDAENLEDVVEATIDAYFEWGARIGPLVRPIYREIHDPQSPASFHRTRILGELTGVFAALMRSIGWPALDTRLYDALLLVVEHVGHRAFWPEAESPVEQARRRQVIARILVASLARPADQDQVPALDTLLID